MIELRVKNTFILELFQDRAKSWPQWLKTKKIPEILAWGGFLPHWQGIPGVHKVLSSKGGNNNLRDWLMSRYKGKSSRYIVLVTKLHSLKYQANPYNQIIEIEWND